MGQFGGGVWSLESPNFLFFIERFKQEKPHAETSPPKPFHCTINCEPEEARYEGDSDPIGPLTVILGPLCASACDAFASLLVDNNIARSYGLPTAGASAPFRTFIPLGLLDGSEVEIEVTVGIDYRPQRDGLTLEGNPVVPEVLMRPSGATPKEYLYSVLEMISAESSRGAVQPRR